MTDIIQVYQEALRNLIKNLRKRPLDHLVGFVFPLVAFFIINYIFTLNYMADDNIMVGVIRFIVHILVLSVYMGILYGNVKGRALSLASIRRDTTMVLNDVWTVYFIFSLLELFGASILSIGLISILIFIFLNPIIEMLYIDQKSPGRLPGDLLSFYRGNILHWLIPLLIYLVLLVAIGSTPILAFISFTGNPLDFTFGPARMFSQFILENPFMVLLGQLIHYFYLLYRGYLYDILAHSNPRKRAYIREYNDGLSR